mmetsp:Transcript_7993/g.20899  ORF Transcript_7993/g.20899 Transcript_7993/m.20899 type:complete len:227 (-) Transcript_7993:637-1317(-)
MIAHSISGVSLDEVHSFRAISLFTRFHHRIILSALGLAVGDAFLQDLYLRFGHSEPRLILVAYAHELRLEALHCVAPLLLLCRFLGICSALGSFLVFMLKLRPLDEGSWQRRDEVEASTLRGTHEHARVLHILVLCVQSTPASSEACIHHLARRLAEEKLHTPLTCLLQLAHICLDLLLRLCAGRALLVNFVLHVLQLMLMTFLSSMAQFRLLVLCGQPRLANLVF